MGKAVFANVGVSYAVVGVEPCSTLAVGGAHTILRMIMIRLIGIRRISVWIKGVVWVVVRIIVR